ncbi:hypothetical protein [Nocardioides sp.]|uniref:hypothetical protein n=1 Tax=Nocardioides sp. TaxID=35761 RepID=UPI00356242E9
MADAAANHLGALAAFNLGIDVAQTVVVLAVVGAIWVFSKILAERRHWARIAICGGAGFVGLTWTASRLVA